MNENALLVPIHLDGLYLPQDTQVIGPSSDFSLLPYRDQSGTVQHAHTPFLGDYINRIPFSEQTTALKQGVHLHWSLPDALTRSMPEGRISKMPFLSVFGYKTGHAIWQALKDANWIKDDKNYPHGGKVLHADSKESEVKRLDDKLASFQQYMPTIRRLLKQHALPAVPNRWLITRIVNKTDYKNWILESDYTWAEGATEDGNKLPLHGNHAQYPIHTGTKGQQAFRYLGRTLEFKQDDQISKLAPDQWPALEAGKYLRELAGPLTAMGYGNPTFAAYYPNCQQVFGFHDELPYLVEEVEYRVIGWYDRYSEDYVRNQISDALSSSTLGKDWPFIQLLIELKKQFQWTIPLSMNITEGGGSYSLVAKEGTAKYSLAKEDYDKLIQAGWFSPVPAPQAPATELHIPPGEELPDISSDAKSALESLISQSLFPITYGVDSIPNFDLACFGSFSFEPYEAGSQALPTDVSIGVGNSDTEALSTFIGHSIKNKDQAIRESAAKEEEEKLEGMELSSVLENVFLDKPAKFAALRHEKGFQAEYGGLIWTLRKLKSGEAKIEQSDAQPTLPLSLASWLDQLNEYQMALDRNGFKLDSERYQLFADWCKYMAVSHTADTHFSGIDQIAHFIQAEDLANIDSRLAENTERLSALINHLPKRFELLLSDQILKKEDIIDWDAFLNALMLPSSTSIETYLPPFNQRYFIDAFKDPQYLTAAQNGTSSTTWFGSNLTSPEIKQLGIQLKQLPPTAHPSQRQYLFYRIQRLVLELNFPQIRKAGHFELQAKSAPRFWRPQDPSILLAGKGLQATYRHSQDGRMRKDGLMEIYTANYDGSDWLGIQSLYTSIEKVKHDKIATSGTVNPWHALLLDWSVDYHHIERGPSYDPDYLFNNYRLKIADVDLSPGPSTVPEKAAQSYTGSVLLTPFVVKKRQQDLQHKLFELVLDIITEAYYEVCMEIDAGNPRLHSAIPGLSIKAQGQGPGLDLIFQNLNGFNQFWAFRMKGFHALHQGEMPPNTPAYVHHDLALPGQGQSKRQALQEWFNTILTTNSTNLIYLEYFVFSYYQYFDTIFPNQALDLSKGSSYNALAQFTETYSNFWKISSLFSPNPAQLSPWEWIQIKANQSALVNQLCTGGYPVIRYWHRTEIRKSHAKASDWKSKTQPTAGSQEEKDYLEAHLMDFISWFQGEVKRYSQILSIVHYYKILLDYHAPQGSSLPTSGILSQSLSGFTDAFLMQHEDLQMPVEEPFPLPQYADLGDRIQLQVLGANHRGPRPLNPFHPIRAGQANITKLRLINTFGQHADIQIDPQKLYVADGLKPSDGSYQLQLLPRLAQAARLNFRWLAAHELPGQHRNEVEMNDHPATNPICGWLLPNHLDNSLMVYDPNGSAQGYIDKNGHWHSYPGKKDSILPADLSNTYLSQFVSWLVSMSARHPGFFQQYLDVVQSAIQHIDPENFAQHEALSLLMGRPLALVRAMVQVELKGNPAVDQGWDQFTKSLTNAGRDTLDFEQVNIPIRIGEHSQLNDGIVGYLREGPNGTYQENLFYSPQASPGSSGKAIAGLRTRSDKGMADFDFPLAMMDSMGNPIRQFLTLLMDPRGKAHATSGILPVKAIDIPAEQFSNVLRSIEIAFQSSPVLSQHNRLNLSLPQEAGYHWAWAEETPAGWREISHSPILTQSDLHAHFPDKAGLLWQDLIDAKWIQEVDIGLARIMPADGRTSLKDIDSILAEEALEPKVIELFESLHISPFKFHDGFHGKQALRDGWLKLRPDAYQAPQSWEDSVQADAPDWENKVEDFDPTHGYAFQEALQLTINSAVGNEKYPGYILEAEKKGSDQISTTFSFKSIGKGIIFENDTLAKAAEKTNYHIKLIIPKDDLVSNELSTSSDWKISAADADADYKGWNTFYLLYPKIKTETDPEAGRSITYPVSLIINDGKSFMLPITGLLYKQSGYGARMEIRIKPSTDISPTGGHSAGKEIKEDFVFPTYPLPAPGPILSAQWTLPNAYSYRTLIQVNNLLMVPLDVSGAQFRFSFELPHVPQKDLKETYNQLRQLTISLVGSSPQTKLYLDPHAKQNPVWILEGKYIKNQTLYCPGFNDTVSRSFMLEIHFSDHGQIIDYLKQAQLDLKYLGLRREINKLIKGKGHIISTYVPVQEKSNGEIKGSIIKGYPIHFAYEVPPYGPQMKSFEPSSNSPLKGVQTLPNGFQEKRFCLLGQGTSMKKAINFSAADSLRFYLKGSQGLLDLAVMKQIKVYYESFTSKSIGGKPLPPDQMLIPLNLVIPKNGDPPYWAVPTGAVDFSSKGGRVPDTRNHDGTLNTTKSLVNGRGIFLTMALPSNLAGAQLPLSGVLDFQSASQISQCFTVSAKIVD